MADISINSEPELPQYEIGRDIEMETTLAEQGLPETIKAGGWDSRLRVWNNQAKVFNFFWDGIHPDYKNMHIKAPDVKYSYFFKKIGLDTEPANIIQLHLLRGANTLLSSNGRHKHPGFPDNSIVETVSMLTDVQNILTSFAKESNKKFAVFIDLQYLDEKGTEGMFDLTKIREFSSLNMVDISTNIKADPTAGIYQATRIYVDSTVIVQFSRFIAGMFPGIYRRVQVIKPNKDKEHSLYQSKYAIDSDF